MGRRAGIVSPRKGSRVLKQTTGRATGSMENVGNQPLKGRMPAPTVRTGHAAGRP